MRHIMRRRNDSGAALIIAIGIMVILLAIALTFFAVSRLELTTATNVTNAVRADNIADAANAIAIHGLNNEFIRHPNVTSTDHAWRTYFNGAAFAGKPWAMRNGVPLQAGGVPLIDLSKFDLASTLFVRFPDNYVEPLYRGERTMNWLYIPRFEGGVPVFYSQATLEYANGAVVSVPYAPFNALNNPFVTSDYYGRPSVNNSPLFGVPPNEDDGLQYPTEQIDAWTDVDNDGDGLRDSLWLPIPADLFFPSDGVDNNLNGLMDESQENTFNQGGDEDGDGYIGWYRESEILGRRLDPSLPGDRDTLPNGNFDPDEAMEAGVFVYNGLGEPVDLGDGVPKRFGDGLDNDGNGQVDEAAEDRLFLSAPLPGIWIPVDFNADGIPGDLVPDATGQAKPLRVKVPDTIRVLLAGGAVATVGVADVDKLDNDFDLFVNNYSTYAYVGPNTHNAEAYPPYRLRGYRYLGSDGTNQFWDTQEDPSAINSNLPAGDLFYTAAWILPGNWNVKDLDLYALPRSRAYRDINLQTSFGGVAGLVFDPPIGDYQKLNADGTMTAVHVDYATLVAQSLRITHSGEPVCELAGRMAVLITDEASKASLNADGGHSYREGPDTMARALNEGASAAEYDTRVLPDFGVGRSAQAWSVLTGSPDGTGILPADKTPYGYDKSFPGYGRTDDNSNLFLLAFNGRDDDGDGLVDEGLRIPQPGDPDYPGKWFEYIQQLGFFEGIDEPQELQRSAPLRNEIAERQFNEIGSLGDRQLNDIDQIKQVNGIGDTIFDRLRNLITVHSTDRNVAYVQDAFGNHRAAHRLDFNYAGAKQIAAQLLADGADLLAVKSQIQAGGERQRHVQERLSGRGQAVQDGG